MPAARYHDTLVYCDPPYLFETRSKKVLYDFDTSSREAHAALLGMVRGLSCMVMLSGYESELYAKALKRWRCVKIPAMTRGGLRMESVWCNFPPPTILHDPRQAGGDFRARERINRKRKRWSAKFAAMDSRERQVIAAALIGVDRATVEAAMRTATPAPAMGLASDKP
jgi:hypothetical protein